MDVLPPLSRVEIENDVEAMVFAMPQHFVEPGETGILVFERSSIVLEVPVIKRNPDDGSSGLPEKDYVVFIEEIIEHALEEKCGFRGAKYVRHLSPESVFCTGMAVDEVFHVHPAARTGTPETNPAPLGIDNLTTADAKELHFAFARGVCR
jgi:hypothetical protein